MREHSLGKIPVILAIGQREVQDGTVSMRRLGTKGQRVMPLEEAVAILRDEVRGRGLVPSQSAA